MKKQPLFFGLAVLFAIAAAMVAWHSDFDALPPLVHSLVAYGMALLAGISFVTGAAAKDE
jgi:hypothetical protein